MIIDNNITRVVKMEREEAIAQYLMSENNYKTACLACKKDRIANRDFRRGAYEALRLAEIDLIDISFDLVEKRLGEQGKYGKLLNEILENPEARKEAAKLSLLLNQQIKRVNKK